MYRRHSSCACVHFGKPTLEALEDRFLPSQFGTTLEHLGDHVITQGFFALKQAQRDFNFDLDARVINPSDLNSLQNMFQDIGNLGSAANYLQQQSAFFTVSLLQGLVQGQLDPSEAGPLLDEAVKLSQLAAQAQAQVLQSEGFAVLAAIDFGLNQSPGSGQLASNFDFNGLADDVVSGAFGGFTII